MSFRYGVMTVELLADPDNGLPAAELTIDILSSNPQHAQVTSMRVKLDGTPDKTEDTITFDDRAVAVHLCDGKLTTFDVLQRTDSAEDLPDVGDFLEHGTMSQAERGVMAAAIITAQKIWNSFETTWSLTAPPKVIPTEATSPSEPFEIKTKHGPSKGSRWSRIRRARNTNRRMKDDFAVSY